MFKTLMATRAATLLPAHVEALNRIDLEFHGSKKIEKNVIAAWKAYLDILGNRGLSPEQWSVKRVDLLVELLYEMAKVLNYEFDKTHIKNSIYHPEGYGKWEDQEQRIRQGLIDLLERRSVLPVAAVNHA